MKRRALFGVAGNPPNFWQTDFRKDRANAAQWLQTIGLDALEIQCGYGVRMPEERAIAFRQNAEQYGIELSLHGPYYISLGSENPKKIENSLNELRKACELAHRIGSDKVIFHLGSIGNDRETARTRAIEALQRFEKENDLEQVHLFPEIAGKIRQLGSLEDVLAICEAVKCAWPCLDLAHLHARNRGSLRTKDDFAAVINAVEARLGEETLKHLHIHLYPVEWGSHGEIQHKAFHDKLPETQQLCLFPSEQDHDVVYLPRYEPCLELIVERQLYPTVICEAKDSQDLGALEMKRFYMALLGDSNTRPGLNR